VLRIIFANALGFTSHNGAYPHTNAK